MEYIMVDNVRAVMCPVCSSVRFASRNAGGSTDKINYKDIKCLECGHVNVNVSFEKKKKYQQMEAWIEDDEEICMCDCHRVGLDGHYHCFGLVCCEYENEQYLETPTRPVDMESGRKAFGEKGILNMELYKKMRDKRNIDR